MKGNHLKNIHKFNKKFIFISELRWFHKFVWIFHEVAFSFALYITVAFWSFLDRNTSALSVNVHAMNLVIMVLDLFISNIPIRILHFYHASLGGVVYTIFSLILHWAGYTSDRPIYPILDWSGRTGLAIGLALITIIIALPIAHLIGFGLYNLRCYIAQQCLSNRHPSTQESTTNYQRRGEENQSYTA